MRRTSAVRGKRKRNRLMALVLLFVSIFLLGLILFASPDPGHTSTNPASPAQGAIAGQPDL